MACLFYPNELYRGYTVHYQATFDSGWEYCENYPKKHDNGYLSRLDISLVSYSNLNSIPFSSFALGTILIDRRILFHVDIYTNIQKPLLTSLLLIKCFTLSLPLNLQMCLSTLSNGLFDRFSANTKMFDNWKDFDIGRIGLIMTFWIFSFRINLSADQ